MELCVRPPSLTDARDTSPPADDDAASEKAATLDDVTTISPFSSRMRLQMFHRFDKVVVLNLLVCVHRRPKQINGKWSNGWVKKRRTLPSTIVHASLDMGFTSSPRCVSKQCSQKRREHS